MLRHEKKWIGFISVSDVILNFKSAQTGWIYLNVSDWLH